MTSAIYQYSNLNSFSPPPLPQSIQFNISLSQHKQNAFHISISSHNFRISLMSYFLTIIVIFVFLSITKFPTSFSGQVSTQFLYPTEFTSFHFVENSGTFLSSTNSTFSAKFYNPGNHKPERYYLAIIHNPSNTIVWSANPNHPLSSNSVLSLSNSSLSLHNSNGSVVWSTPSFPSKVDKLQLLDSGNLILLDKSNTSLWQSFDHPTDTLLPTQKLATGSLLTSQVSGTDLSGSGYSLLVTSNDVVSEWMGTQQYWSLSLDPKSIKDYSGQAAYMQINGSGFYLFGKGNRIVYQVLLPNSNGFRVGKLEHDGRFRIITYSSGDANIDFIAPVDGCELPFTCNTLGLCPIGTNMSTCLCPDSFRPNKEGGCIPTDGSVLPSTAFLCNSSSSRISYYDLGSGNRYFANKYAVPISGNGFSSCQDACSSNCTCVAFSYMSSTMLCYLVYDQLGSLIQTKSTDNPNGYVKVIKSSSSSSPNQTSGSPTNILPIVLPLVATTLLVLVLSFVGIQWWRKKKNKKLLVAKANAKAKSHTNLYNLGNNNSTQEDDSNDSEEEFSIPGLPMRFTYEQLDLATNKFQTLIGSGGFGSVYKGELPDKSLIAVKKITNIGIAGKKEFCTEIAVIGKIHHVNLVKLRGYCAQGSNRLLVYEYMNRSSLDRPLFGQGPALEWQERLDIAIGAARGLSYLHSGCDNKILHCDIKPENILLADFSQVKIADFGMAKLMTPEQSGLFTTMRGTRGYLAPEWLSNTAISDKTDVYSYGMVLLEIVRGRKNRYSASGDSGFSGSSGSNMEYFPMVAVEKHVEGKWAELVDPRMGGRVVGEEVERVVKVALCCLHEEPWNRPSMAMVVGMLEGTMGVWEPKVEGLKFLRLYGRGPDVNSEGVVCQEEGSSSISMSLMTYVSSQEVSGPR